MTKRGLPLIYAVHGRTGAWCVSPLGTLTLSVDGSYAARNGAGRFVRQGDAVRLTAGPWAGARGDLQSDNSGAPAVCFDLDDNRRVDGSCIVDPWRTSCTTQAR